MFDALFGYLPSGGFLPFGDVLQWSPLLVGLYIGADALIGCVLGAFAVALWISARREPEAPYRRQLGAAAVLLFAAGTAHALEIWTIWQPAYWADASIKAAMAAISVGAAIALWPLVRQRLPAPGLQAWFASGGAAEPGLEESEARYRFLFESNPMPMWVRNVDTNGFLAVNDAATRLYGYTRKEFFRMTGFNLRAPEDQAAYREFITERKPFETTTKRWRHRAKNGMPIEVEVTATGFTYEGRLVRLAVVKDIRDQLNAERELQVSEQRYRELFDLNPSPMMVFDLETLAYVAVNEAATLQYGYTKEEFSGMTILHLFPEEDREPFHEVLQRRDPRSVTRRELRHRRKDGTVIHVETLASPLPDPRRRLRIVLAVDITQRKRTEDALRESEERFRAIFEQAEVGIALRGVEPRNPRWLRVNQKLCDILGYTEAELTQLSSVDVTPPEERDLAIEYNEQLLRGELTRYSREKRYLRKDGQPIWANISLSVVRGPDKQPTHIISVIQDVTERKRAEQALRESEERYRSLFELTPSPMLVRKGERLVYANPAAVRFFGARDEQELTPREWLSLIHEEEREAARARYRRVEEQGGVSEPTERRFLRIDGTVVTGEVNSTMMSYGGERYGIVAIHDLTERLRAEEARRESEERYRKLVEMSPSPILLREGPRVILANPAALRFFGAGSAEQLADKPFLDLVHPDHHEIARSRMHAIDTRGASSPVQVRKYRRLDGEVVYGETSGTAVQFHGRAMSIITIHDITEQHRAAEAIRQLNAELEQRVKERTAELEVANKELESFAYSVSHDLRAPLRSIDGFSRALLEDYRDRFDDTGRDYLRRVRNATQRMGNLIDDLLTLSRITRSEMQRETVSLSALAQDIAAELQKEDPQRDVEFDIHKDIKVKADPSLLRVALHNLLHNAWKFTGNREEARIEVGTVRDSGRQVYFVRDNGVGFDMTYADRLFGAFQRLHSESEFPGTGVGLATVQRIVRRHGGEAWANAEAGRGATFYFTLGHGTPS